LSLEGVEGRRAHGIRFSPFLRMRTSLAKAMTVQRQRLSAMGVGTTLQCRTRARRCLFTSMVHLYGPARFLPCCCHPAPESFLGGTVKPLTQEAKSLQVSLRMRVSSTLPCRPQQSRPDRAVCASNFAHAFTKLDDECHSFTKLDAERHSIDNFLRVPILITVTVPERNKIVDDVAVADTY